MSANAPQATDSPNQTRHRLGLVAIPVLSTAFGYVSGYAIDQQLVMAGFGLLWGASRCWSRHASPDGPHALPGRQILPST